MYYKNYDFETIGEGVKSLVIDETDCDTWGHGKESYTKVIGRFQKAKFTLLENGPLRTVLKAESAYEASVLSRYYILESESDEIKIKYKLDWHEKHRMLKIAVNTSLSETSSVCEIPFTDIERCDSDEEHPCLRWVAVKGKQGVFSATNDCKYGFSENGGTLFLTSIRSPIYGDHGNVRNQESLYTDQGESEFSYAFSFIKEYDRAEIFERAERFNAIPEVILENRHKGYLADEASLFSVDIRNVATSAIKRAENGKGDVLRLYEVNGEKCETVLSLQDKKYTVEFTPYEIKTLFIDDDMGELREILITEL